MKNVEKSHKSLQKLKIVAKIENCRKIFYKWKNVTIVDNIKES